MRLVKSAAMLLLTCFSAKATASLVTGQHFVNRNTSCPSSGGCSFSFTNNITVNSNVIVCASDQGATVTLSISMTGETWVTGTGYPQSPGIAVNAGQIYCWLVQKAVGGNKTVVITPASGTQNVAIGAAEFSSTVVGNFTDDTSTFHDGSCASSCSNTATTGSITPTSSTNDIIFAFMWYSGGTASTTCTANNSFTVGDCDPAAYNRGSSIYLITSDTSAHTPSLTMGGATPSNSAAVAIAVKEPAASATKIRHTVTGGGYE